MTYYSKKAIVSIITMIIVYISFYPNILAELNDLGPSSKEMPEIWGEFFLILLLANIIIKIVVTIIFKIVISIISKDKEPTILDERDQLIELKAIRNFCFVFSFGFFIAMATLVFNQPLDIMFKIFAYAFLFSGITLEASYIFYYEREA